MFLCFLHERRKENRKKKIEKIEKSPQGNIWWHAKLVKVLTYIRTKSSLLGPVKKLNCRDDTKISFLELFKLFIFYEKILHALKALKA